MTVDKRNTFPSIKKATSELVPYASNSRTHDDKQIEQIMASIQEWGFTNPIIIDEDDTIIAGHGRVMAATKLGLEEVPCVQVSGWTDAQKKAYVIADNKLALNAGWDKEMLALEFDALKDLNFDVELTGFGLDEIPTLNLEEEGLCDEDEAPPIEDPVSVPGDVWLLGKHVLVCGDSTAATDMSKLMNNGAADLIFTDPPYDMSYGKGRAAGSSKKGAREKAHGMIKNDDLAGDDLIALVADSLALGYSYKKEGGAAYVCFTWRTYAEFQQAIENAGGEIKACIVWNKESIGLGKSNYRPQHEFIFYCSGQWYGDKSQSDVWEMSRGATADYVHPTQKPVELIVKALQNSTKKDDVVLDLFGGSGSTLIACEKTKRQARIMELDPRYVDVIIRRWQNFTGKQAVNSDGETFTGISQKRDASVLDSAA